MDSWGTSELQQLQALLTAPAYIMAVHYYNPLRVIQITLQF